MKSKLVSRNPIQRFKQGKNIIKAQLGVKTPEPTAGTTIGDYMRLQTIKGLTWRNKKDGSIIQPGQEILVDGNYLKGDGTYTSMSLRAIKKVKQKDGRMIYKMPDGTWRNDKGQKLKYFSSPMDNKIYNVGYIPGIEDKLTIIGKNKTKQKSGWSYGFDRSKEISDIQATQQMLQNAGFDIGKYGADGKWGKDTEAAYLQYLKSQEQPETPIAEPTTPLTNPISTGYTPVTFSFVRNRENLNRSQTRDRMREAGYNPYNFTGGQRKALRLYLNGESDDTSKLGGIDLTKFEQNQWVPQGQDWRSNLQNTLSLSYHKKGGTLSSKNPITRFKENFRLVAQ